MSALVTGRIELDWFLFVTTVLGNLAFYFVGRWLGYRKGLKDGLDTQKTLKEFRREWWGADDHIQ